ncbi:transposase [Bradyrhizobium sp. CIR3A]|nr:transposase [Bradyrhizobium sp. CIR3A]
MPDDKRAAIDRHVRELDRLAEDLTLLDREIAQDAIEDSAVNRLMTITGVNLAVAAGILAAIGDISRFNSSQKLVSYFGLNPRVRQSGLGAAITVASAKSAAIMRAPCWSRGGLGSGQGARSTACFFCAHPHPAAIRSPPWPWLASSLCCAGTC